MARRFKTKNYLIPKIFKVIIVIIIAYFGFYKTFSYLYKTKLKNSISNEQFLNYLLATSTNNLISNTEMLNFVSNFNLNVAGITNKSLNNYLNISVSAFKSEEEEPESANTYFEDPNNKVIETPLVYIYNSHQSETYKTNNLLEYNITPSVLMASYIMKEKLNDMGVKTIVEEQNITEILRVNNWKYKYSYVVSRILLDDIVVKEPSLKYFIDIHRDSSKREKTIIEIDGVIYARVLFVVGLDHDNYERNLSIATDLNNLFKKGIPNISRGIYKKGGKGVNGIYNQDISPNALLLELGGQYNTIEEVNNTLNLITPIIGEYIKGRENIAA